MIFSEKERDGGAVFIGCGVQPDSQLITQAPAQIKPDSGGGFEISAVFSGKALVKHPGKVVCRNADSVIMDLQHRPFLTRQEAACYPPPPDG